MLLIKRMLFGVQKEKKYQISAACVSHRGKIRKKNEDNLYFLSDYLPLEHEGTMGIIDRIFVTDNEAVGIFDGMGGESAGELASYVAVKSFSELVKLQKIEQRYVYELLNEVNKVVCEKARERKISLMGTTASIIFFENNNAIIINLGDSPIYLFRKNKLQRISQPHTNETWLKENNINKKPALTQFLGLNQDGMLLEPYLKKIQIQKKDIYLICSDGLTDMVTEKQIQNILKNRKSVKEKTKELLECALENGGIDNITIILCEVG